jgi:site-specific DNA-methyltransferase (adenine-specific)
VGKFVGMSGRTLEKATQVVSAAQQEPEKYGQLVKKMDEKGKVDGAFRELRRLQTRNSITADAATPAKELYSVVLAIPPWVEAHQEDGAVADKEPLQVMSLKEMKKMRPPIAADAALFLQTPPPSLASALDLLGAWGFKYKTFLVWACSNLTPSGWLPEIQYAVLLGVRGNRPSPLLKSPVPSVTLLNTLMKVSDATIYDRIERMFPGEKCLEVFTRSNRQGWSSWSGHTESDKRLEKTMPGNPATGLR